MTSFKVFAPIIFLLVINQTFAQSAFDRMSNEKMNKILIREAKSVTGSEGAWEANYKDVTLTILTSADHNRMRIVSPVIKVEDLETGQMETMLEANFDKALDAKYSIYNGIVWSTFTHPLGELTVEQFKDAMGQVVNLVNSFGTTYTSTHLVFGGGEK